jgi:hypothetical protein
MIKVFLSFSLFDISQKTEVSVRETCCWWIIICSVLLESERASSPSRSEV